MPFSMFATREIKPKPKWDVFLGHPVALLTSNVAISVHILRNHFRGGVGVRRIKLS